MGDPGDLADPFFVPLRGSEGWESEVGVVADGGGVRIYGQEGETICAHAGQIVGVVMPGAEGAGAESVGNVFITGSKDGCMVQWAIHQDALRQRDADEFRRKEDEEAEEVGLEKGWAGRGGGIVQGGGRREGRGLGDEEKMTEAHLMRYFPSNVITFLCHYLHIVITFLQMSLTICPTFLIFLLVISMIFGPAIHFSCIEAIGCVIMII